MRCPNCNAPVKAEEIRTELCEFCGAALGHTLPTSEPVTAGPAIERGGATSRNGAAGSRPDSSSGGFLFGLFIVGFVVMMLLPATATDWGSFMIYKSPRISRMAGAIACPLPHQFVDVEYGSDQDKAAHYYCVSPGKPDHYQGREWLLKGVEVVIGLSASGLIFALAGVAFPGEKKEDGEESSSKLLEEQKLPRWITVARLVALFGFSPLMSACGVPVFPAFLGGIAFFLLTRWFGGRLEGKLLRDRAAANIGRHPVITILISVFIIFIPTTIFFGFFIDDFNSGPCFAALVGLLCGSWLVVLYDALNPKRIAVSRISASGG